MSQQSRRRQRGRYVPRQIQRAIYGSQCHLSESLERRQLLTGSWTALTNNPGVGLESAVQLSNGSIMVNREAAGGNPSAAWYKLTPVNGNYVSGTWSALTSMHVARRFFAADVLPSGKVLVLGGEYASDKGDTNTGEIYDPQANTWTNITPFPQSQFGDGDSVVLSDGRVLCGYLSGPQTYIYNPVNDTWATGPNRLNNDSSSEESWVKLPDDSILSYEISGTAPQTAQRFILGATDAQDHWVSAGTVPVALASNGGNNGIVPEEGPAFLLPDGRAFFVGATSNTAIYTPSSNTWVAGPSMAAGIGAFDAPGCMMPNGHVLIAAGPNTDGVNFPGPTRIYEYDPVANTMTQVTIGTTWLNVQPFQTRMIMAPSGQVLMSNATSTLYAWTPDGGPSAAWQPTISNITNDSGSNVFTLSGYQLNGISEGASYGDDAQMATDFPLVRLTDQAGNITFARTFNWSSTSVAGGYSTVNFTLAPGQGLGAYLVNVIASGIASPAALDIQCSVASGENFTMQANANTNYTDVAINGGAVATFWIGAFNTLIMTGDAASNTLVINDNFFGRNTVINGGDGNDYLRIENNGTGTVTEYGGSGVDYFDFSFYARNLSNISGFAYVYGGDGADSIFVYDNNYSSATTYSVTDAIVSRTNWSGFYYGADVENVTVTGGTGVNTFNVTSTYYLTPVSIFANANGTVNIGNGGSVQSIAAQLYLDDSPAFLTINVDDSTDAGARTVTMGTWTPAGDTNWGYISGLSPANINYEYADTTSINVATGTSASNVVNMLATGVPTNLNGAGGTRTVNVGSGTQGVQGILGTLVLNASSGLETVNIDDTADTAARTMNLDFATVNGYTSQRISGLAPAVIYYYLSGTTAVSIKTSDVYGDVTNVLQLATATSIIGTTGTTTHDIVNIGNAGSLVDVTSPLTISHPPGYTDININGYTNTNAVNYTFSSFVQSSVVWGQLVFPTYTLFGTLNLYNTLSYVRGDVGTLTVNPGPAATAIVQDTAVPVVINELSGGINPSTVSLTANIQATTASLTVNTSSDDWYINAGNAGSVQGLHGAVTITSSGFGSYGSMVIDDSADAVGRNVTISDSQMIGLAPAVIAYPQFRTQYTVNGGTGGNNFTVTTTPVGGLFPTNVLNSGSGNDTVMINGTQASLSTGSLIVNGGSGDDSVTIGNGTLSTFNSPVTVNGGSGNDLLTLDDHALNAADTYAITPTTVTRPNFSLTYGTVESLTLLAEIGNNTINVNGTVAGTPVKVNAEAGTDVINVNKTDPTAAVIILPSTGGDAVHVDAPAVSSATALFSDTQQIGAFTIASGGLAGFASGAFKILTATSISLTGTGKLDMGTNEMLVNASVPSIEAYLHGGQIFTSASGGAVGYLGLGGGVTEVKFTLLGDTNLDGHVDVTDLGNLASSYGVGSGAVWVQGDTNYDGAVDVTDLGNLASNYGGNLGGSLAGSPMAMTLRAATAVATPADCSATPTAAHAIPATSPAIPWRGGINGVATVSFEDATDRLYQDLEPVLGVRTTAAGQGWRSDGNG